MAMVNGMIGRPNMARGTVGLGTAASNPSITGAATEATSLTGVDAVGYGTVTSRKWQRSYDNSTWLDIPSATSTSYTLKYEDVGNYVRFVNVADSTVESTSLGTITAISVPDTTPASPVTGDILSVSIDTNAGGKTYATVTVKGFTTGATYAYGMGTNNDPSAAKVVFDVYSEGYDSAGNLKVITRRIYGTRTMRKAYPSEASLDESVSGSDLVFRVALSNWIYADDNTGVGKSGRAPIVTIAAGLVTNSGGAGQTSRAAYLTCTNNSTTAYRMAFGQWDTIPAQVATSSFRVGFTPRHTHGIACVRFDADGASSSANVNATVSTWTARQRTGTSLYGECLETTIPITGFTQGERVDLRCRAYPTVGDATAILDTNSYTTTANEILGRNKSSFYCNKNDSWSYAVVNFSTGNDATAVVSSTLATANASPYLKIGKAIDGLRTASATFARVYVRAGTGSIMGTQPASVWSNNSWCEVRAYPGDAAPVLTNDGTFFTNLPLRLRYVGATYRLVANSGGLYGNNTTSFLWYDGITFDANGYSTTNPISDYMAGCYLTDCLGVDATKWDNFEVGSDRCAAWLDGCVLTGDGGSNYASGIYRTVACTATAWTMRPKPTANPAPDLDNLLCEHNKFMSKDSSTGSYITIQADRYVGSQTIGMSFVGNIIETTDSTVPVFELFDGSSGGTEIDTANIVVEHNTFVGQRFNFGYNDYGTTAYKRLGWSIKNNASTNWYCKGDDFTGNPGGGSGNRTGAWPLMYGVNCAGNRWVSTAIPMEFDGIYCDGSATMGYTNDNSATGSDDANGDYTPAVGSDLLGNAVESQVHFDMLGNAVAAGGDAGAIQT